MTNHDTTKHSSERFVLQPGDAAPEFTLPAHDGTTVALSGFRGERVVLWFYPEALSPGCTKQACDFRDSFSSLAAAGIQVIGISRDTVERQAEFAARDGITFPLLADPDLTVHHRYGTFGEKKLYGKVVQGDIRSTFFIGPDGVIEQALTNVKATGHVARVRKLLGLD